MTKEQEKTIGKLKKLERRKTMKEENFDFKDFILVITIVIIFILLFANFYKNLILKQEKINILRNINNLTSNVTIVID